MYNFLSKKQRQELLEELRLERIRRYAERIKVILLLDEGKTYKNISQYLFLDEGTISNYRKRYENGGVEGLINDDYFGRKTILSPKELKILSSDLQKRIFPCSKAIIAHVKKKFCVKYSRGGMTNLLHKLGFSFKKATPVPGKAKKKGQEEFVKKYLGLIGKGRIYFGDSTHPEFAPSISYGWIKKGLNFNVKTNSGRRKRVNICGVVDISSLDTIVRIAKSINYLTICKLLVAIRRKNPFNKKVFLILDGASYNRAVLVKKRQKC